jgi:hypothetical protein
MIGDLWIVIPNWGRFQHYGKRRPIWVKNYTALLHKDEYLDLTLAQRGLLHGIWLAYAECNGQLKASRLHSWVSPKTRLRHLEQLEQAGFIQLSASPEVEVDKNRVVSEGSKQETPVDKKRDIKTLLGDLERSLRAMPT